MKAKILRFIQYLIFIGLSVVLMWLAFRSIDLNEFIVKLKSAHYEYVALSLVIGFLGIYFRAVRWRLMIEPLGYLPPKSHAFYAVTIGYMANYAFPRIGEITRCGVLNRSDKIPADSLIGTVISERIFDLLVLLILTVLVVFIKLQFFGNFFYQKIYQPLIIKFGILLNFSAVGWLLFLGSVIGALCIVYLFREKIRKITFVEKIRCLANGVIEGAFSVFKIKNFWAFLFYTVCMWVTYWTMTYTFLLALDSTSELNYIDALFIMVAGSYGMAAPVQAGIGAFHGIVALALSIYFISWNDSLAYAFLSHGSQAVGIIILGALALVILFYKNKFLYFFSKFKKAEG